MTSRILVDYKYTTCGARVYDLSCTSRIPVKIAHRQLFTVDSFVGIISTI